MQAPVFMRGGGEIWFVTGGGMIEGGLSGNGTPTVVEIAPLVAVSAEFHHAGAQGLGILREKRLLCRVSPSDG